VRFLKTVLTLFGILQRPRSVYSERKIDVAKCLKELNEVALSQVSADSMVPIEGGGGMCLLSIILAVFDR